MKAHTHLEGQAVSFTDGLLAIVGTAGLLDMAEVASRSAGAYRSDNLCARALVRPENTQQVSAVLKWCHAQGVRVVPQGGLTGLVHGADASAQEVILSLERMRCIERIDATQRVAVVQAGVTLQSLQEAAQAEGLSFPLDLGARGSATLGGNAATNAGGNRVIRYGMMRELVLGLEAVLADGTIVTSMNELIKNNAGYDLKQLFIGSEGTLGVITRLVLRLREQPGSTHVALVAVDSFDPLARLLKHMDRCLGGAMTAFEVMWRAYYDLVTSPPSKNRAPLATGHAFYALIESQGSQPEADAQRFEAALASAFDDELIVDAALAQSESDAHDFWAVRENVEMVAHGGLPIVFDVSLPVAAMEGYAQSVETGLRQSLGPAHRLFIFGHLGDGNLHIVVQVPPEGYARARPEVEAIVYGALQPSQGSVSAEHGIGLEKRPWLSVSRSPQEVALMRTLKLALDPKGILNSGKVFDLRA